MDNNNKNMNLEEKQEDIVTKEDILLYSAEIGPRIFNLNNMSRTTLLGVLMEESDDSFLVGLPATLVDNDGVLTVETYANVKYFRLLKGSVVSVMFLFGVFNDKYMDYVKTKGSEIFPELVESIDFSGEDPSAPVVAKPTSTLREEEVIEHIKDSLEKGGIILNGSKSKH